jgi:predicted O-linked N-acetylglucosamine transferase (SPINDLY family)
MLLHYDRDNFEVACYSNSTQEDAFTARFRGAVDRWRNICAAPDAEAEQLILRDGIDILVDLSGHTLGNRLLLFARKPAPIQVTAWGGVTGTGLDAMDYIFGDTVLIPQTMSRYFREKVIHLPCAQTYMPQAELPPVKRLPASGRGFVTFGYFNNYIKLSSASLDLWARLLGVLPSSQMVFKAKEFDRPQPRARVVEAFGRAGISAERLIFRGRTSWYEHLDAHGDVDVVLDPFPIVGGISALEALSMGTPVVVLEGVAAPNRISASILAAVGMEAWIARSPDHYLSIAVERAQDISGLETLRHSLRGRLMASAAGDPVGYARAVESVYRALWRNWCDERRR